MRCPLCQTEACSGRELFPAVDLIHEYRRQLAVDVTEDFESPAQTLSLGFCSSCGLEFFNPPCDGSPDFYRRICAIPDYYADERWEFGVVRDQLADSDNVVDVGCGSGRFLSLLPNTRKFGLEHNPAAIARAQTRGIDVRMDHLVDLPDATADAVTVFQVLEHVADPRSLINDACRVLRPGGRLFISVPNNDGFVGALLHAPLNGPPHHVLRWGRQPLERIASLFPLNVETIACEPLPPEQRFDHCRAGWIRRLSRLAGIRPPVCRRTPAALLLRKLATALTYATSRLSQGAPRAAIGHTILASYRRCP